jgi:formylglycine-generating enzyme required for sulfatase activity
LWEWCWDRGDDKGSLGTWDWKAWWASDLTESNTSRVLRGGSFYDCNPGILRSAYRVDSSPGIRNYNLGFRFSRTK